jgi:Carboxypeptidase regulatory-like domain
MSRRVLLAVLAVSLWVPTSVSAQVLYGSVVGNVNDSSGAAIPEASVTILQSATGFTRQAQTNHQGQFEIPSVPGGTYKITIAKTGFANFTREDLTVSPNSVSRIDAALAVGAVPRPCRSMPLPSSSRPTAPRFVPRSPPNSSKTRPLPPGRNYTHLFKVLPGFTYPRNGNGPSVDPSRAAMYNVNGTSQQSNSVRLEGSGVNQIWLPHLPGYTPALESIETVNITSNSFDAETGLAGGAAVNVSIKSGTNDLHGSLFEYHNSNVTKAKPFFLPPGERKPKQIFNQMGGTIGGPILRQKLFFFGSYEGRV